MFNTRNLITVALLVFMWMLSALLALVIADRSVYALVPFVIAAVGTLAVFHERFEFAPRRRRQDTTEKRKRAEPDKVRLLMDMMDEDEREAFKQAMKDRLLGASDRLRDDGELPADADMLDTYLNERKRH